MTTKINYRNITNTGVVPGTYNSANVTVNAQGQITAISRSNLQLESVKNTDFTAEVLALYPCNTSLGEFTVTLPQIVSAGQSIILKDYAGTWDLNNVIVNPGNVKVNGNTGLLRLFNKYSTTTFYYVDNIVGWTTITQSSNTETIPIEYLLVGGGGGGGKRVGGGGGAGGLIEDTYTITASNSYQVTIGAGGVAANLSNVDNATGFNGQASIFGLFTAQGGGGGGSAGFTTSNNGKDGGSGGGTATDVTFSVSKLGQNSYGINKQGNQGAIGSSTGSGPTLNSGGGGGGGAYSSGSSSIYGGNGGIGARSIITGISRFFAGGGGGGRVNAGASGLGGIGGGGNANTYGDLPASAGLANTGGGGGASSDNSTSQGALPGNGGSGILILAYPSKYPDIVSASAGLRINSAQFQGSINGTTLTVTNIVYGTIVLNTILTGTDLLSDTTIVSRGTGIGGIGTYQISRDQTLGSRILNTTGNKNIPDLLSRPGYKVYEFTLGTGTISW